MFQTGHGGSRPMYKKGRTFHIHISLNCAFRSKSISKFLIFNNEQGKLYDYSINKYYTAFSFLVYLPAIIPNRCQMYRLNKEFFKIIIFYSVRYFGRCCDDGYRRCCPANSVLIQAIL